jgi:hypothetical protein
VHIDIGDRIYVEANVCMPVSFHVLKGPQRGTSGAEILSSKKHNEIPRNPQTPRFRRKDDD